MKMFISLNTNNTDVKLVKAYIYITALVTKLYRYGICNSPINCTVKATLEAL